MQQGDANHRVRVLLSALQGMYIISTSVTIARLNGECVAVDMHFTATNILQALFAVQFTHSSFKVAEAVLVINFFNLLSLYLRHPDSSLLKRAGIISGPFSWVLVALYWNGSMMIPPPHNLAGGILATICIWSILCAGLLFTIKFTVSVTAISLKLCSLTFLQDCTIAMSLSVLAGAIGAGQYQVISGYFGEYSIKPVLVLIQCNFAFIIAAAFTLSTIVVLFVMRPQLRSELAQSTSTDADAKSISSGL